MNKKQAIPFNCQFPIPILEEIEMISSKIKLIEVHDVVAFSTQEVEEVMAFIHLKTRRFLLKEIKKKRLPKNNSLMNFAVKRIKVQEEKLSLSLSLLLSLEDEEE